MDHASTLKLSSAISALLTPLLVTLWSRLFPPRSLGVERSAASLRRRNTWIDVVGTGFMFAGLIAPLIFLGKEFNSFRFWAIGLSFGLMVSTHFLWVCIATMPFGGRERFGEFWRYYEVRWGIAMTGIRVVYIPISIFGLYSALKIWT